MRPEVRTSDWSECALGDQSASRKRSYQSRGAVEREELEDGNPKSFVEERFMCVLVTCACSTNRY